MRRRLLRGLAWASATLALFAVAGFFAVPPIAKNQLGKLLSEELARPVTVERVEFNPFTLRAAVVGVSVGDRDASLPPALTIERLDIDAAWRSIVERAPVIESARLTSPSLRLARAEDGSLSIQDLIRKWREKPRDPDEPPARFATANLELEGGSIAFDDRLERREHRVTGLVIRVPFVSSLPVHQEIHVEPKIAANVNGSAVEIAGRSQPFSDDQESSIEFEIAPIDLAPYAGYLPQDLPVGIASLLFGADVRIDFARPKTGAPTLSVSGRASLAKVDVRTLAGDPLVALASVEADGLKLQPFANSYEIGRVAIDGAAATVHRKQGEARFFERVLVAIEARARKAATGATSATGAGGAGGAAGTTRAEGAAPPTGPSPGAASAGALPAAAGPRWSIAELVLSGGTIDFVDEGFTPRPLALKASDVKARIEGLGSDFAVARPFELSLALDTGERVETAGSLTPLPLAVEGKASAGPLALKSWWWIAQPHLQADLLAGSLAVETAYKVVSAPGDKGFAVSLAGLAAELKDLRLQQRWDRRDVLKVAMLKVDEADLDLDAHRLSIGSVEGSGGFAAVTRDRDGELNLARLLRPPGLAPTAAGEAGEAAAAGGKPGRAGRAAPPASPASQEASQQPSPWSIVVKRVALDRWEAQLNDAAAGSGEVRVSGLSVQATELGTGRNSLGKLALKANVGATGSIDARGQLGLNPVSARMRVDARRIGLLPVQPYFTQYVNAVITSGQATVKGDFAVDAPEHQPLKAGFAGEVTVADFAAVTKAASEDLLRWKSLHVGAIDFALEPLKVDVGEIALSDFYSRLVLGAEGRLNLQDVIVARQGPQTGGTGATGAAHAQPQTDARPPPPPVRIGRITLANGNVDYSDFFVRPNYTANLTGLNGTVTTLVPGTPGNLELRGRIDNSGSVEITGSLDPLAPALFLDLKASARGIDLPRASPYSVKYLGYGIEKGKLSANLRYTVQDRRLQAENNIVLDQLTFGEKVESPTATKLPVLFAVALLKDRHGVIDVNMPIGGSLDDPEFSVAGIVLRIVFNLIAKAVTAPFTLLANLAGGGAELSQVEFAPGRARLEPQAKERLDKVAKALNDRPGLRLDLAGRVDPERDREALRRIAFERSLKAQKARERGGASAEPGALDEQTIEPAEYERLLKAAYRAADFAKPRNTIGLVKDLPPAEMEQLMLANSPVADEALGALASDRAEAARQWLVSQGGVTGERLFVVAPRLNAEGLAAGKSATAVDLSLK